METILIVDDDPIQQRLITQMLSKKLGYQTISAHNGEEAVERVLASNVGHINAVLLDIHMPKMDGFEALHMIRKFRPDLPVIMLTGSDDSHFAVKAIKAGASDFIVKTPEQAQLDITIKNAIRVSTLARELNKLKREKAGAITFYDLIGHNRGLADAVALGRKAAASLVPVLITGETGVGKELFARAIHGEGKRAGAPFVVVNCSALPPHAAESMLFDTISGACRRAEGGTLFLDDVCRLPQDAQISLLRLLQHKEIESGKAGKPLKVNVRIIAATEKDISREIEAERFREDLYFRLTILPIAIPPLRARKEDIMDIATHFAEHISLAEGLLAKHFNNAAAHYLLHQAWRGNVRELENLVHRALVLSEDTIIDDGLLKEIHQSHNDTMIIERRKAPELCINLQDSNGLFKSIATIEQEVMHMALAHADGNITRAAQALDIAKSTFYRKVRHNKK